jgi:Mg2+ and Co2+ transporter CorA
VLTLRQQPASLDTWCVEDPGRDLAAEVASTAGLVLALLLAASVRLRALSSRVRQLAVSLSSALDADLDSVSPTEILVLKREITDLEAIADERAAVMEQIEAMDRRFLQDDALLHEFRLVLANTNSTARRIDRLGRRANDLQSRFDSHQQERMNRRLSRLTIISAIFLPLTLMAGIYGMNFAVMPELQFPYSYPILLVLMAGVAVGMVWWFRSRGWMD